MLRVALLPLLVACGSPPAARAPAERAFHLAPLTDLVAAPKLEWLVDAEPRALYAQPALATALEEVVSSARLATFSKAHGGLDPRGLQEVVYVRFEPPEGHAASTLLAGRGFVPAPALEQAELQNVPYVRQHAREPSGLVRIEGRAGNEPLEVLLFGHQGVLSADTAPLAAKVARAFAEERLRKTKPALQSGALAEAAAALGAAPVRVFGARPDVAFARDGLLEHFEALAVAFLPTEERSTLWITLRVIGVGPFAGRTQEVEAAVRARLARLDRSRFGAFFGLGDAAPWTVQVDDRVARVERRVQGARFLHGLHLAMSADTAELFESP